ncbi:hypothetical protein AWH56_003645 [Anaerobacillus isosaccharinicus]|uniref:Uncharacterized protein n=2 Tax=Anaerobacillus isosaccharinicus TaxID=1532552 RepID=A0A7S7L9F4_9BACI|nr:hypothetical protein [Anaerobacillus isosaccharinicus]MBA5584879.1 hypothetical protein [Anaerobacillus isosaccharinicus]QOY36760.1 hypothetical protein AWH56_003645 [Anaerobacillus isosaccharinicus]
MMTLSFIIGPIIALIVFMILINDKWEIVLEGKKHIDEKEIYEHYQHLKNQDIRCKVVRVEHPLSIEGAGLQLFVMEKDLNKINNLGHPRL